MRYTSPPQEVVDFVKNVYRARGAATVLATKTKLTMGSLRRVANGEGVAVGTIKRIQKHMPEAEPETTTTAPNALVTTKGNGKVKAKPGDIQSVLASALLGAHPEPEDEVSLRVARVGQGMCDVVQLVVLSMNQFVQEEMRGLQRRRLGSAPR